MTDEEFDIIDELYFVTAYNDLREATDLSDDQLRINLIRMANKGWVRVYKNVDEESEIEQLDMEKDYRSYYYLASKKGLFEHNTQ
ncbi:transporter [Ekhidna sp.]|uniref:transporter n=1 Tax=Ekhidna sp. TaxID=2608089 RepID=UPI0032EACB00